MTPFTPPDPADILAEVTVHNAKGPSCHVYIGDLFVATLPKAHAEEYAERLRGSADERRKALGET